MGDGLTYWSWRFASVVAQRTPPWLGYLLAVALGNVAYITWETKREIAKHNLAPVLRRGAHEREVAWAARRSFQEFAKYLYEVMRFPRLAAADIERLVEIRGEEHLERALALGRGVIFVSAHWGNFELGAARIASDLRRLNVVADDLATQRLYELLIGHRAEKGIVLMSPEGAAKKVLQALRRNEMVGLMMDLGPRAHAFDTVQVRFFGRDTTFPAVAAHLARVSGAPIVVGSVIRRPGKRFLGVAHEPIFVERTRRAVDDIEHATQRIVSHIERFVAVAPEQWYIFRPMWPLPQRSARA